LLAKRACTSSEAWLNRKRSPDKRNALRIYFQHNHKRSQPRCLCRGEGKTSVPDTLSRLRHLTRRGNPQQQKTQHTHNNLKRYSDCKCWSSVVLSFEQSGVSRKIPLFRARSRTQTVNNNNNLHTIEIWLILPVVICLFQGLSHACLRITALQESAHGSLHQTQSAAKMLRFPQKWITWRNAKLIHESLWCPPLTRSVSADRSEAPCE
jgi:hypothetical protein